MAERAASHQKIAGIHYYMHKVGNAANVRRRNLKVPGACHSSSSSALSGQMTIDGKAVVNSN